MIDLRILSAVAFDMDGTLIDSEPLFKLIATESALELGFTIDGETYGSWVGLPREALEKAILKSFMHSDLAQARSMETKAMKKLFGSEDNLRAVEKFFARKK